MKLKLSSLAIAAAGLIASTSASALIVGGVDFGAFGTHLETSTIAETNISGSGQLLTAFGQINTVNGAIDYTPFDNDRLYFTFTYTSQNFTPTSVEFIGGLVNVYKGLELNLLTLSSAAAFATISGLTPWVQFVGHANLGGFATPTAQIYATGITTGTAIAFTGAGLLDVNPGFGIAAVAAALNGNSEVDAIGGLADVTFTSSGSNSVLNALDPAAMQTRCRTGAGVVGDWCLQGSGDFRGRLVVPEPSVLSLLGLALVGFGFTTRRKSKAS